MQEIVSSIAGPPEAVLFDFDLTLADSTAGVIDCANHALTAVGLPAAKAGSVVRTIGLPLPQSFRMLTGFANLEWSSRSRVTSWHELMK